MGSIPGNPYGYYVLLRWVCCPLFAYLAVRASDLRREAWMWIFAVLAVVYNPIFRVHATRDFWTLVNVGTVAGSADPIRFDGPGRHVWFEHCQRLGLRRDFFWRQESASMSMTWQCWAKRSTRATTQAAPGKTEPHCLKARLVVTAMERCSWRRETML